MGRFETVVEIIEGAINEYTSISGETADTLEFSVTNFDEIQRLFIGVTPNAWASYGGSFFDKFKETT